MKSVKRNITEAIFIMLVIAFFILPADAYSFSRMSKETPEDFNEFLDTCTIMERIQMMQALQDLPREYLTMKPALVWEATSSGKLDARRVSAEAIRKALVWRSYNKLTYAFRGDSQVDYHGIVQWVAGKSGIDSKRIKTASTFELEKEIAERYLGELWEHLSPEQQRELLGTENEQLTEDINMAGNVVKGVGAYTIAAFAGFALWNPYCWFVLAGSGLFLASSEVYTVKPFIMTVNMIKTKRFVVNND